MKKYNYLVESILCESFKPNAFSERNEEMLKELLANVKDLDVIKIVDENMEKWRAIKNDTKGSGSADQLEDMLKDAFKAANLDSDMDKNETKVAKAIMKFVEDRIDNIDFSKIKPTTIDSFVSRISDDELDVSALTKLANRMDNTHNLYNSGYKLEKLADQLKAANIKLEAAHSTGKAMEDEEAIIAKDPTKYKKGYALYKNMLKPLVTDIDIGTEEKIEKLRGLGLKYRGIANEIGKMGDNTTIDANTVQEVIGALTTDYEERLDADDMMSHFGGINSKYSGIAGKFKDFAKDFKYQYGVKHMGKKRYDEVHWFCDRELKVDFFSTLIDKMTNQQLVLAYMLTKLSRLESESEDNDKIKALLDEAKAIINK